MEAKITTQDVQIIERIKEVVPQLSPSSKDKLLTVVETMMMLHEAQNAEMTKNVMV